MEKRHESTDALASKDGGHSSVLKGKKRKKNSRTSHNSSGKVTPSVKMSPHATIKVKQPEVAVENKPSTVALKSLADEGIDLPAVTPTEDNEAETALLKMSHSTSQKTKSLIQFEKFLEISKYKPKSQVLSDEYKEAKNAGNEGYTSDVPETEHTRKQKKYKKAKGAGAGGPTGGMIGGADGIGGVGVTERRFNAVGVAVQYEYDTDHESETLTSTTSGKVVIVPEHEKIIYHPKPFR